MEKTMEKDIIDKWIDTAFRTDELLRKFFEQSKMLYIIVDGAGVIKWVNNRWVDLLGYSREELYTMRFWNLIHPEDMEETMEIFNGAREWEYFKNRYKKKQGTYINIYWLNDDIIHEGWTMGIATTEIRENGYKRKN